MNSEMVNMQLIKDIAQLKRDIKLIKEVIVDDETELTDWAKNALEEARNTPISECKSLEEVEQMIMRK